jgi:hypothetical protein
MPRLRSQGGKPVAAVEFIDDLVGRRDQFPIVVGDERLQLRFRLRRLNLPSRRVDLGDQIVDRGDRDLHLLVAEHDRTQHDFLGQSGGFRFDHQHGRRSPRNDEIELGVVKRTETRVQEVFAVLVTDPGSGDGAVERHPRHREGGRRADHGGHVRIDLRVSDMTVQMICTSLVNPLGNSGRTGRSMSRQVSVSFSVGRPSRLKNPPGILPAA